MMMNNNTMFQELNDTELDMVNGGGFFDAIKGIASDLWDVTKDVAEILEFSYKHVNDNDY